MNFSRLFACSLLAFIVSSHSALADDCPCPEKKGPPPPWTGSIGAGFALTGGNTDTSSINITGDAKWDPKTRNVLKLDAFYLRTTSGGAATADKITAGVRDEYGISDRVFAFGEVRYLKDRFKGITYLISPLVGGGYYVVKSKEMNLSFDAGIGGAFEQDTGDVPSTNSAALHLGQAFDWQFTPYARVTEAATALWKTNDFKDALYHFEIGLVTSISKTFELKLAFMDDYKNKPPSPTIKKNDTSFIGAVIYKF